MSRPLGFTVREHALAVAIFAAVTLAFFYPMLTGETFSDVDRRQRQTYPWAGLVSGDDDVPVHYDQADSFHPWQVFTSRQLRRGEFPHWDPFSFAGHPFYANGQSGVLYPPRLALSFAVSPARVHDLLLVSHFFAAGVAMFLLLGVVRLGFTASLAAALAWMTNSFALAWQALEHYVAIAVWLPLALLLAHVVVRRASWPAALALTLVLGLLVAGGQVLFVELALVAVAGYAFALALGRARTERSSLAGNAARLATVSGLLAALTAVATIPVLILAGKSTRVSLSYDELGQFALAWGDLVNVLRVPALWAGDPYHVNLFAGTATALLAAVGAFARHPLARFAVVLGALTTLFMLHTPVTWVVAHVLPGFDSFKPLARAAFLLQLALAILAAFGMQTTLRFLRRPRALAVIGSDFVLGVFAGTIVGGLVMRFGRGPFSSGSTAFVFGLALVLAICVIVVFDVPARGKHSVNALLGLVSPRSLSRASLVGAALVAVVAGSIVTQARLLAPHVMTRQPSDSEHLYPATPLTRFLEANGGMRVLAAYPTFRG